MEAGKEKRLNIKGMDDLIRHLGHPGRFQILVFVLVALNYFPVVFHHVCMAFYGYTPPFECHPGRAFPPDVISEREGTGFASSYQVKDANSTAVIKNAQLIVRSCDVVMTSDKGANRSEQCKAGEFRYMLPEGEKTVVLEWDLVCDRAYFTHLATTVYYCGVMLGGFACGYLSDHFGRRPILLTTLAGVTILGTGLAFIRDFPAFVAVRFLLGFLAQGLHTASYITAVELFPVEERTLAGCLIQVFWGAAVLALGALCWLLKDWRRIQLAISLPSVVAVSYFWLVPESLRWLLARDRYEKAEQLIRRIAVFNKLDTPLRSHPELATWSLLQQQTVELADSNHNSRASLHLSSGSVEKKKQQQLKEGRKEKATLLDKVKEKEEEAERKVMIELKKTAEKKKRGRQGSVKDLFSSTLMLKRSMVLFYVWFAGNVSYFGLTFMSTTLAGNRFLNYSLSGGVEFFSYLINIFVVQRFGRRNPLCIYYCVAAISCLGVGLVPRVTESGVDMTAVITAFSVLGKFAAGGSFTFFELLTVEMYPTVLRNVGAGLCGFWGRLGAVVAPQFLNLGLYTFSQLPAILIGALTLLGALLTLLLPDTSHLRLPDTVFEITVDGQGQGQDRSEVKVGGEKGRGQGRGGGDAEECSAVVVDTTASSSATAITTTTTTTATSAAATPTAADTGVDTADDDAVAAAAAASEPLLCACERVSSV
ncbi:organic cation transporter protein-like [Babylonia areolata]|uniref:organic cation transporter protein-like n=1 Tax=Babylonia areolata TaxID=304850 RepID=UPI003FD5F7A9